MANLNVYMQGDSNDLQKFLVRSGQTLKDISDKLLYFQMGLVPLKRFPEYELLV